MKVGIKRIHFSGWQVLELKELKIVSFSLLQPTHHFERAEAGPRIMGYQCNESQC